MHAAAAAAAPEPAAAEFLEVALPGPASPMCLASQQKGLKRLRTGRLEDAVGGNNGGDERSQTGTSGSRTETTAPAAARPRPVSSFTTPEVEPAALVGGRGRHD